MHLKAACDATSYSPHGLRHRTHAQLSQKFGGGRRIPGPFFPENGTCGRQEQVLSPGGDAVRHGIAPHPHYSAAAAAHEHRVKGPTPFQPALDLGQLLQSRGAFIELVGGNLMAKECTIMNGSSTLAHSVAGPSFHFL